MYTRDWRNALRTPPTYRLGNRSVRFNFHFALLGLAVCVFFIFVYLHVSAGTANSGQTLLRNYGTSPASRQLIKNTATTETMRYNGTYPLTAPLPQKDGSVVFRLAMVADLDTNSKFRQPDGSTVWRSFLQKGQLTFHATKRTVKVSWDVGPPLTLESGYALKGRGMELSELVTFDGRLLSFDDRTGLVYELINDKVVPWVILLDGNRRNSTKGFKAEWATVKQHTLYIGSMGKEWTSSVGVYENDNPMFVKTVKPSGEVHSVNWGYQYRKLRLDSLQISWPGYMIHESGIWSELHRKWYFLPRRCSLETYNETQDEYMGCNLLISADEHFEKIHAIPIENIKKPTTHGFSSFKFIPKSNDSIILAIKSEELNGKTSTFIMAFDIEGRTVLPEERIDTEYKYEGIEFI